MARTSTNIIGYFSRLNFNLDRTSPNIIGYSSSVYAIVNYQIRNISPVYLLTTCNNVNHVLNAVAIFTKGMQQYLPSTRLRPERHKRHVFAHSCTRPNGIDGSWNIVYYSLEVAWLIVAKWCVYFAVNYTNIASYIGLYQATLWVSNTLMLPGS